MIDLKTIPDMDAIVEDGDAVRIGALAKLSDVADSDAVKSGCAALAEACARAASPTIRHMGTIGGNACQMHRCWYFRTPDDRFHCKRKGGDWCPARVGDNRYHSIFGDQDGCYAASSHDTAPALVALGATVVTSEAGRVPAEEVLQGQRRALERAGGRRGGHRVQGAEGRQERVSEVALRKSIDFPLVNCAVAQGGDGEVRVVLGGVYPAPVRSSEAEAEVAGGVNDAAASKAGDAAVAACKPLGKNAYKVEIARTLVKRTLMDIA